MKIEKFRQYVEDHEPDPISIRVLFFLITEYFNGRHEPIFDKMIGLENQGLFSLCTVFLKAFIFFGINEHFLTYKQNKR